ncbi:hypothetical protein C7974DRAFT_321246 [Boeremia exigua]|uniref:uncharacterized protein n=1 Tax=Boeremia exigua TaxID=749465 RepID=UPI001E8D9EB8|nr:uncharacterized protein C7974DRAFT_321246 [Boeremia exigua]KAH6614145.1 hypothetical protein C7974DRAFT_321246 [Boeremia exigua]
MGRPKRQVLATIEDTVTPPDVLPAAHLLARIVKAEGKNLYSAELPGGKTVLAELEPRFRSTVWIKRGSYVVVDTSAMAERDNKLDGVIVNIVRDEKAWRKSPYWPGEFVKKPAYEDSDDEASTVGKMPPTDSDEDA